MGRLSDAWQWLTAPDPQQTGQESRDMSVVPGWTYRDRRSTGSVSVTQETALRHSAVWACLRLRANLESTLPVDAYREVGGRQTSVAKPQLLIEPFPGVDITEHLFSSRMDLDRYGNSVGVIRSRTGRGLPGQIELAPMADVTAKCSGYTIDYWRIGGEKYKPEDIWHERQYTVGGFPIGLSPIAYGAWSIGGYLSAQQFALDWFGTGAMPAGELKYTKGQLKQGKAQDAKANFKIAVSNRDIFTHDDEWEWVPAQQDAASSAFLDERQYGITDVCRFLDVPADLIDAPSEGSSITYANITQRNVQLLVVNMGPAIIRRERKWSTALEAPRFVKLNTDALLRMDPQTRTAVLLSRIGKDLTPDEVRELNNLPPFTEAQWSELERAAKLGKTEPAATPDPAAVPALPTP